MSKAGRKPKYATDLLYEHLNNYVEQHPNTPIKYSQLAAHTGIPYHVWRDNKQLKNTIEKLNTQDILVDTRSTELQLPSVDDIMLHYNNKKKLKQSISDILIFATTLYEKALKGEQFEKIETNYKIQIQELEVNYKSELQKANAEIQKLTQEIDNLYLDSRNSLLRDQKGLKNNMIDIAKYKDNRISKDIKDIKDEFKSLFE